MTYKSLDMVVKQQVNFPIWGKSCFDNTEYVYVHAVLVDNENIVSLYQK